MASRRPVAPDGTGGLSQIVAADPIDAAILSGTGMSRRPLAPDGSGGLSQIAPPDFLDPSIVPGGGSGTPNVTALTKPGIKVSTGPVALRSPDTIKPGIKVSIPPLSGRVALVRGGVAVSLRPPVGTLGKPVVKGGVKVLTGPISSLSPVATDKAGFKVVQHQLTLTRTVGANAVTQSGVSGSGFVNPTNAQGIHDGTFAVLTGSATAAQAGTLTGTYVNPDSSKAQFTIASVTLKLYWKVTGDTLSSSVVTRSYSSTGIGSTVLGASHSGSVDNSVTPESFDITAAVGGSWTKLNGFAVVFTGSTPLANTAVISLDAIELIIVTQPLVTAQ